MGGRDGGRKGREAHMLGRTSDVRHANTQCTGSEERRRVTAPQGDESTP
jgi:hypothetical protein